MSRQHISALLCQPKNMEVRKIKGFLLPKLLDNIYHTPQCPLYFGR